MLNKIKSGLIVSCQAEGNDPFNTPDGVALFARAVEMGGAVAIRSCGLEKVNAIVKAVHVPVIGLTKSVFEDAYVKITRSREDVRTLFKYGCEMVAIDGTFRVWEGLNGPDFIRMMKNETKKSIMADISTLEDALACQRAGADCVSTTLNGYTPETEAQASCGPNFELIKILSSKLSIPVIAEGRISSPKDAQKALQSGAYAVVVGTAITRPRILTATYIKAMKENDV